MKRFFLLFLLLAPFILKAQMTTRVVRDSLFIPWELIYAPDSHIWFNQKNGFICRLNPTTKHIDTLYHETNVSIQSEGGMLGMALDPNFATNPYVYVAYNYNQGGYKERIVKYTYNIGTLSLGSPQILLDNIAASSIHNGCRLLIVGDKLFITTGDASNTANSQNTGSVNGKTLRINLDGSIPTDNPIAGSPVWSWGHRNAQGMVYANNRLYQSEHGPNNDDEINIVQKARNYGWPTVQGFCNTPAEVTFCTDSNVVEPLAAWTPTIAVGDLDYYNHPMFPNLQQCLLLVTLKDQRMYRLKLNSSFDAIDSTIIIPGISFGRLRAMCIGPNGNIFISTSMSSASGTGGFTDKIIEIYDPNFVVPVSIKDKDKEKNISIYPNPATDIININITQPLSKPLMYRLVAIDGATMLKGSIDKQQNHLGISALPAGIYYLQVTDNAETIAIEKIIKH